MSEYGLSRLVLLNSANYERAEIPLDDSVSIIGPNNAGKTSLINALQFLLISDRRQMDFGAHDEAATLRFYFPSQSSYILLEAQLESGLAVLGCVGKGASHEYQHFAYTGSLLIEDYRCADGSLVQEPDLREHLSQQGRSVQYFPRSTEFFDALYGKANRRTPSDLDLRLYHLESTSLKAVFQQILVRTLRLDKLQAEDVKKFLLQIFAVEYGTDIDFNKIWHRAFDSVNADRLQYQSCRRMESRITTLGQHFHDRLEFRGRIGTLRPQIDQALQQWESHKADCQTHIQNSQTLIAEHQKELKKQDELLVEERSENRRSIEAILTTMQRQKQLESDFALVHNRQELEEQLERISQELSRIKVLLQSTLQANLPQKERDLENKQRELNQLKIQLENGENLLGTQLQSLLTPDEMNLLNGLVQEGLFHLDAHDCGDMGAFATQFQTYVASQKENLNIWGLHFEREKVSQNYRSKSASELQQEISTRRREIAQLQHEIHALKDRKSLEEQRNKLQLQENQARKSLTDFEELETLQKQSEAQHTEKVKLEERQNNIEGLRREFERQINGLEDEKSELKRQFEDLNRQHNSIAALRSQRRDHDALFLNVLSLRHTPWYQSQVITPAELDVTLREQNDDCRKLMDCDNRIREILRDLHLNGFTKFQSVADEDEQIQLCLNYASNLDQEDATLQKAVRTAVTSVASSLKELDRQFEQFQNKLRSFNQLIGKRRLSDLERFRIELREHPYLLDAIRTILQSSEAIEKLESQDLFDTVHADSDAVGDKELDRAKDHLLGFSKSQGSLKLDHLFGLEFEVAKGGQSPMRFDQLDKIGSNGTVLMAKLVSGLALLYWMLDKNHKTQTICYLDEAASLDDTNQESLISTAREFGFTLLFASPTPQNTVRYCVPIEKRGIKNLVTRKHWQIFESLESKD